MGTRARTVLFPAAFAALVFTLLAGAPGCRTASRGPTYTPVSDADFGRLAPSETGPVDRARATLAASQDEAARMRLRAQETRGEEGYADADRTAAAADAQRAGVDAKAAKESNDPGALARAAESADAARLRQAAADAHLAYARHLGNTRSAEVAAADARVKLDQAELDRAKLVALQQAGIPAAGRYDATAFDARVEAARRDFEAARQKASAASQATLQAQGAWQALQQRWQARAEGSGGRG